MYPVFVNVDCGCFTWTVHNASM